MISGDLEPADVSLARTSPRTRYCCPPTLGEHVEQNVSLATSSDARLRRPVRVTYYGRRCLCHGTGPAPRKTRPPASSVPPAPHGGLGVYIATRPIPGRIFGAAVHHSCPKRRTCRVGKGRPAGSIELRVSPSPSKIPYGGFSPVRLQMDRQWRPSTTSRGLSAVHIRLMRPSYTPPQLQLPGIRDPRRDYPFENLSVQCGTTPNN